MRDSHGSRAIVPEQGQKGACLDQVAHASPQRPPADDLVECEGCSVRESWQL